MPRGAREHNCFGRRCLARFASIYRSFGSSWLDNNCTIMHSNGSRAGPAHPRGEPTRSDHVAVSDWPLMTMRMRVGFVREGATCSSDDDKEEEEEKNNNNFT